MHRPAEGEVQKDRPLIGLPPDQILRLGRAEGFPDGREIDRLNEIRLARAVRPGENGQLLSRPVLTVLLIADLDQTERDDIHDSRTMR